MNLFPFLAFILSSKITLQLNIHFFLNLDLFLPFLLIKVLLFYTRSYSLHLGGIINLLWLIWVNNFFHLPTDFYFDWCCFFLWPKVCILSKISTLLLKCAYCYLLLPNWIRILYNRRFLISVCKVPLSYFGLNFI